MTRTDIIGLVQDLPLDERRTLAADILADADEIEAIERAISQAQNGEGTSHDDVMRQLKARIDAANLRN